MPSAHDDSCKDSRRKFKNVCDRARGIIKTTEGFTSPRSLSRLRHVDWGSDTGFQCAVGPRGSVGPGFARKRRETRDLSASHDASGSDSNNQQPQVNYHTDCRELLFSIFRHPKTRRRQQYEPSRGSKPSFSAKPAKISREKSM